MKTYRQTLRTATEVRYADPDAFFNTATVKASVQPKKAGARTVYNVKSGINMQRTVVLPAPVGCTDLCAPNDQEKLACGITISGSTQSREAVKQLLADMRALSVQFEDDLVSGFLSDATTVSAEIGVV